MVDQPPEPRPRSALVAAVLSVVVPGAGQLYAGARNRGFVLLAVDAFLLVIALLIATDERLVLELGLTVAGVGSLLIGNIAVLAYRVWAADDAARLAGSTSRAGAVAFAGGAAAVLALVLLPHLVVGRYTLVQYDVLDVFADEDIASGATTTTTAAPGSDPDDTGATTTTLQAPEGPPIWDGLDRLNLLLLGGDSGAGRREIRTDTMIVVSIDPVTGDTAMFSIPRNMVNVPLPDGYGAWDCDCFPRLLNDLYIAGIESPGAFPGPQEPEVNAVKAGIGHLLGLDIHYYALVTLDGFVGVVDALGGVVVDVQFNIVDESYPHENGVDREYIDIPVGRNEFDGHMALAYARIRRNANDYARMQRQRCVLEAVIEQSSALEFIRAYPELANVLQDSLRTDIPRSRLVDFVELARKVQTDEIVTLRFIPPDYISGSNERGNIPNVELIREHTRLATSQNPQTVIEALGIESLDSTCA
jgi:LCP family protein required for cell wall assembly